MDLRDLQQEVAKASWQRARPELRSALRRYGAGLGLAAGAILLTYLFRPFLQPGVFLFFYPAVVAAAWYGGLGPGLLVAVGGVVTAELLFMQPLGQVAVPDPGHYVFIGIFVALTGLVSLLVTRTERAQRLANAQAAEAHRLADQLAEQGRLLDQHAREMEARALELQAAMAATESARREAEAAYARSEAERRRVGILSETSAALAAVSDYDQRLHVLARLVAKELADYCIIDVLTDGGVRRLAVARDPSRQASLDVSLKFGPGQDPRSPVLGVIRDGKPVIRLQVDRPELGRVAISAEHLRFLEELGVRSAITMPLAVAERRLGAITVTRAAESPPFQETDVELVQVLAGRAAVLIEMAGLYHEAKLELERRQRAEEILREKSVHLEALNVAQQRMLGQLAERTQAAEQAERAALEASQAKSQFLAVMSHELRTPLNAIMGYTDLLQAGTAAPQLAERERGYLDRIRASVLHLRGLIDEVLSLSRIEAGREETRLERVALGQLVKDVAGMVQRQAAEKGLAFRVDVASDVVVVTDAGKVRQILLNLASNAVKFTDAGEVTLRLHASAGVVELEVSDTGVGIPHEYHSRIFEPFTQADQSRTRRVGGSGLGLSVSRKLALLLGGELSFESAPGRGTRFVLSLPISEGGPLPA